MKLKQLLPLSLIIFITACNLAGLDVKNVKYKSAIKKDGSYKLMIPEFMDSTTRLHKEAGMQYANPRKEFYVVVFDETKEDIEQQKIIDPKLRETFPDSASNLNSYFSFMTNSLKEHPNYNLFDTTISTIKKASAKIGSVTLSLDKAKVFYRVAAVETNKGLYQIYVWTLESNKEKFQPVMDSIIKSFKEF